MKYCPYCGAGLDMDMRFCPKCGKPFEGGKENPHLTAKHLKPESLTYDSVSVSAPQKGKKRGGIIAIVIVAVLITVGAGLYFSGFFAPKEEPKLPFSDDTVAIAENSNSVVISEFSENNEHLSPNQVYTIDFITNNYEELDGKTISIEGYICYIDSELKTFYLISTAEDARNPNSGKIDKWGQIWLQGLLSRGEAIAINYNDNQEMLFSKWEDKTKVTITGRFSIQRNANNSLFTMSDITFDHTPPIQIYTPDYVVKHYEELEGKEIIIEGYVSSKTINNNGITSIHVVNEASNVLGYEVDANNGDLSTLLKIVAEEAERSIEFSFNENQNKIDLHAGDKLLINSIIEVLHGKQDGVAYTKPSFILKGIEKIT